MRVSNINTEDIAVYLRLDPMSLSPPEMTELGALLNTARSFVRSYTGLDDAAIDTHEDFYIVVLVLCQDMYDNRTLYVDKSNLSKVVDTILSMHAVNYL